MKIISENGMRNGGQIMTNEEYQEIIDIEDKKTLETFESGSNVNNAHNKSTSANIIAEEQIEVHYENDTDDTYDFDEEEKLTIESDYQSVLKKALSFSEKKLSDGKYIGTLKNVFLKKTNKGVPKIDTLYEIIDETDLSVNNVYISYYFSDNGSCKVYSLRKINRLLKVYGYSISETFEYSDLVKKMKLMTNSKFVIDKSTNENGYDEYKVNFDESEAL